MKQTGQKATKVRSADAAERAKWETKFRLETEIFRAAARHWQAAAWWLERKYPEEYGPISDDLLGSRRLGWQSAAVWLERTFPGEYGGGGPSELPPLLVIPGEGPIGFSD